MRYYSGNQTFYTSDARGWRAPGWFGLGLGVIVTMWLLPLD